jgi:Ca-activated chloride channel family protein
MKMMTGRVYLALFGLLLMALVAFGLGQPRRVGAQDPSQQQSNRPRRAGETPRPSPTPDDDTTLRSDEVVRVDTNLTNVLFTAADRQNRFLTTIKREDIRVLEDGVPQEIFTFQPNSDLPLSLAILIDTSASEEFTLPEEKAAARTFLQTVLRANKDEAAIVSFTGEVTLEQGLTGNIERLRHAIDRVVFAPPSGYIGGGITVPGTPPISGTNQTLASGTAIWDAIWVTSRDLLADSAEHTRRAIILLTDGVDTVSQMKMADAVDHALKADALIYAIGIGDRYHYNVDSGSLKKITERTGGRAYFPRNESDLRAAFDQIQRELREQYLVAYSPSNKTRDGSYRRVTIELTNPELRKDNPRLTYRPGYFAKGADMPPKKP